MRLSESSDLCRRGGSAETDLATVRRDPCARPLFRTDHANEGPQMTCEILEKESEKLLKGVAR